MNYGSDESMMQLAISLAEKGKATTQPNPMVGAVIVKNAEIVGEGYHARIGEAHAEIRAINHAGEKAKGGILYVNLEPCSHHGKTPPCTDAIIASGISRVVCSDLDPNPLVNGRGLHALKESGIAVEEGILKEKSKKLNEIYYKYITTGRPFVTLKMAQSLDGKITYQNMGRWISGALSRRVVHEMRSHHLSIMVGIGTVEADDPLLNIRYAEFTSECRQPLRVIVDSTLRLKPDAALVKTASLYPTAVFTGPDSGEEKACALRDRGIQVYIAPTGEDGKLDLHWILAELGKMEISSVLVEGGRELATSFISHGLVDKVVLFLAPRIIGRGEGIGAGNTQPLLELKDIRAEEIDEDIMITGYPLRTGD